MINYDPNIIFNLVVPVYQNDPVSTNLSSPGLIWYNSTSGSIKYTYNVTGSPGIYCVKSVNYT